MFELAVSEQNLYEYKSSQKIISDSIEFAKVKFYFDESWDNLVKTAQFKQNGKVYNKMLKDNIATVPVEIKSGECAISVFGVQGAIRATTNAILFNVEESGYDDTGDDSIEPSPTLFAQLIGRIEEVESEMDNLNVEMTKEQGKTIITLTDKEGNKKEYTINDGVSPTVLIEQTSTGTKITITDVDGMHIAEVVNGKDGENGKDGTNGIDGISPIAKIVQTETGAIMTVVDADGTTTARLTNGKDGKDGIDGENGISPTATVTQITNGATVSITDVNGTTTATIYNGKDGISEETDPIYIADKPNIALKSELPAKVSELENDSKFISSYTETDPVYSSEKSTLALKSELPIKLSQLQNDSEFINKTVNNLTNYYAKTETYTKTEINNLIGGLGSLDLEIVQELPTTGDENKIYLLAQNREAPDIYDEYLYINGWEKIGNTKVDLTNYYTKAEVDNLIPTVPTKVSELENDSGYLKEYTETDPTVPTHVKGITQENITNWNNKSEFSGSYNDLTDKPTIPSIEGLATIEQLTQGLSTKQDTLTPGNNITIENGVISATGSGGSTTSIKTTLWEGEFTSLNTFSATNTLSDNVKNYDYVIVSTYQIVPSNNQKARILNILVDTSTIQTENVSTSSTFWVGTCNDCNTSNGYGYFIAGNFGGGTQLCISSLIKQSGVSSRTHGICKVVGIKY